MFDHLVKVYKHSDHTIVNEVPYSPCCPLLTLLPNLMDPCSVVHAHCNMEWPQGNEGGLHGQVEVEGRVLGHGGCVVHM